MVSVPSKTKLAELPSYLLGSLLVLSLLTEANAQPGRTPQATPTPEESDLEPLIVLGWILGSMLVVLVCRCCYQYANDPEFRPERPTPTPTPTPPAPLNVASPGQQDSGSVSSNRSQVSASEGSVAVDINLGDAHDSERESKPRVSSEVSAANGSAPLPLNVGNLGDSHDSERESSVAQICLAVCACCCP